MNFFIWFGFLAVCFGITHGYGDCGRCDPNAHCEVDKCVCLEGFKGNGTTCVKETSECDTCSPEAKCIDNHCRCNDGYDGNGTVCRKACTKNTTCPGDARCVNGTCVKQDCQLNCTDNARCVNDKCQCNCGFKQDGDKCVDAETMCKHCPQLSSCENVEKDCRCKSGFVLDGSCCLRNQAVAGVMEKQSQDNVTMHMPNSSLLIVGGVPPASAGRTTSIDEMVSSNNVVKSKDVTRKSRIDKSITGKRTLPNLQSVVRTHSPVKSKRLLLMRKEKRTHPKVGVSYPFLKRTVFDIDPFSTLNPDIKVDPLDHYPKIPLEFPGQDPNLPCLSADPIEVVSENENAANPEVPNMLPINPAYVLVDNHVIDFKGAAGTEVVDRNEPHSTNGDVPPDGNTYQLPSQTLNYPKPPKVKPPPAPPAQPPAAARCAHPVSTQIISPPPPPPPTIVIVPTLPPPQPPQSHLQVQVVYPNPKKPIPPQVVQLSPQPTAAPSLRKANIANTKLPSSSS